VQFAGDEPLQEFTNAGVGIDAPFGVVNTFWSRVDVDYEFANGKWFSFWTVDDACDWSSEVVTLGLEDTTRRLTPAHLGMQTFEPDAPAFPFGEWARITIYIDYHAGVMHVWQDGASVVHGTFTRPATTMCQWHWGAYANGDNDDVVLFEDDNYLWKLDAPWIDFADEPLIGQQGTPACAT